MYYWQSINMTTNIKIIEPTINNDWDEFVENHPLGSIYHHSTWNHILYKTFNYKPVNLLISDNHTNKTVGVMPMMQIHNPITGNKKIVSLPLTTYCDQLIPEQSLKEIIEYLINQYPDNKLIELKFLSNVIDKQDNFEFQDNYVNHIIDLDDKSAQDFFNNKFNKSFKRKVKKAEINGLIYEKAKSVSELKDFYRLLKSVRKRHGLPPIPFGFFKNMWNMLEPKGMMFVPVIKFQGKIIAADIILKYKNIYYSEYSASDSDYFKLGPNQFLIWKLIQDAYSNNIRKIDLGRANKSNKSLIQFKEKLGSKAYSLNYYFYPKQPKSNIRNWIGVLSRFNWVHYTLPQFILELETRFIYKVFG